LDVFCETRHAEGCIVNSHDQQQAYCENWVCCHINWMHEYEWGVDFQLSTENSRQLCKVIIRECLAYISASECKLAYNLDITAWNKI